MTKKDFILIAKSFKQTTEEIKKYRTNEFDKSLFTLRDLAERLAIDFKNNNVLFNRKMFITACGFDCGFESKE